LSGQGGRKKAVDAKKWRVSFESEKLSVEPQGGRPVAFWMKIGERALSPSEREDENLVEEIETTKGLDLQKILMNRACCLHPGSRFKQGKWTERAQGGEKSVGIGGPNLGKERRLAVPAEDIAKTDN